MAAIEIDSFFSLLSEVNVDIAQKTCHSSEK